MSATASADDDEYYFNISASQCRTSDKTVWSMKPLRRRCTVKTPAVPYTLGLTATSGTADSARELFSHFIDDQIVADIVTYTNKRIDCIAPIASKYRNQAKAPVLHTSPEEIMALIGVLVQSGAKQDNRSTVMEMWITQHGAPLYLSAMNEKKIHLPPVDLTV